MSYFVNNDQRINNFRHRVSLYAQLPNRCKGCKSTSCQIARLHLPLVNPPNNTYLYPKSIAVAPSFQKYVLIDQYKAVVDVLYRADAAYWKIVAVIGLDKSIYLNTLDCPLKMSAIYRNAWSLVAPPFDLNR